MIVTVHKWAKPRRGQELNYSLAWKHRHFYMRLVQKTPWWQLRKKERRWAGWARAVDRTKIYGADVVTNLYPR